MKNNFFCISFLVFTLFSCNNDKTSLLTKTWRASKSENHYLDSVLTCGQAFIDTMGKNNDDSANMRIYGFTNMDSARKEEQKLHDETLAARDSAIMNTVFTFRKDGVAIILFGGQLDSNKWSLDNHDNLIVESMNEADKGEVLKWRIAELRKEELKLVFRLNDDSTLVTFHPEVK